MLTKKELELRKKDLSYWSMAKSRFDMITYIISAAKNDVSKRVQTIETRNKISSYRRSKIISD